MRLLYPRKGGDSDHIYSVSRAYYVCQALPRARITVANSTCEMEWELGRLMVEVAAGAGW